MFWRFDYGDGTVVEVPDNPNSAGVPRPSTHTYAAPGTYTLTMQAIDADNTPRTVETPYGNPDVKSGPWPGSWQSLNVSVQALSDPAFQAPAQVRPNVDSIYDPSTPAPRSPGVGSTLVSQPVQLVPVSVLLQYKALYVPSDGSASFTSGITSGGWQWSATNGWVCYDGAGTDFPPAPSVDPHVGLDVDGRLSTEHRTVMLAVPYEVYYFVANVEFEYQLIADPLPAGAGSPSLIVHAPAFTGAGTADLNFARILTPWGDNYGFPLTGGYLQNPNSGQSNSRSDYNGPLPFPATDWTTQVSQESGYGPGGAAAVGAWTADSGVYLNGTISVPEPRALGDPASSHLSWVVPTIERKAAMRALSPIAISRSTQVTVTTAPPSVVVKQPTVLTAAIGSAGYYI